MSSPRLRSPSDDEGGKFPPTPAAKRQRVADNDADDVVMTDAAADNLAPPTDDGTMERSEAAEGGQWMWKSCENNTQELATAGGGDSLAEPPQIYDVITMGDDPVGASAEEKELSVAHKPPPEGSTWLRLPNGDLLAFPTHAVHILRREGICDGGYKELCMVLEAASNAAMTAQQRQIADHAKLALDKMKATNNKRVAKHAKSIARDVVKVRAEFKEEIEQLEFKREELMEESRQQFANEVAAKKLTPGELALAYMQKGEAMNDKAKTLWKIRVEMSKLDKMNRIVHTRNQKTMAEDLLHCGNDFKDKVAVLEKMFEKVENEETDSFDDEEGLVYWYAACDAFSKFVKLMPTSEIPEKEMTEKQLSDWKLDLQNAYQKAGMELIDRIYMLCPCKGCNADLRRASNRGGANCDPNFYKYEMDNHTSCIPCVFHVFPSNTCAPCVGNQPLRRYPEDVAACLKEVGAIRTCKKPFQVDEKLFHLSPEELASNMSPGLKKLVLEEDVDDLWEELNDGKAPIGCDPWTDALLALICLKLRRQMGEDRRLGLHIGAFNRALCRLHKKHPDIPITEMLADLFEHASTSVAAEGSGEPSGEPSVAAEGSGDEEEDDEEDEADLDDQSLLPKPAEEDVVVAAGAAGADEPAPKKPRKSKKVIHPISSPKELLEALHRFCAGDDTALITAVQPASPDNDNLSPKQREDMQQAAIQSAKENRAMLKQVSEEYWELRGDPNLSEAEKQEEVIRRLDQIVLEGFAKENAAAGVEFWDEEFEGDKAARATCLRGLKSVIGRVRANVLPERVFQAYLKGEEIEDPKFKKMFENSCSFKEWRKKNISDKAVTREIFGLSAAIKAGEDAIVAMYKRVQASMEYVNKVNKKTEGYVKKSHMRRADVKAIADAVAVLDPNQIHLKYGPQDGEKFKLALQNATFSVPENLRGTDPTPLSLVTIYDRSLAVTALRKSLTHVKPKVTRAAGAGGKKGKKSGPGPSTTPPCLAEQDGIQSCFVMRKKDQKDIDTTMAWNTVFTRKMGEVQYTPEEMLAVYRVLGKDYKNVSIEQAMQGWYTEDNECVIKDGGVPWKVAVKIAKGADVPGNEAKFAKEQKKANRLKLPLQNGFVHAIHRAWQEVSDEIAASKLKDKRKQSRVQNEQQQHQVANSAHMTQGYNAVMSAKNEEIATSKKAADDALAAQAGAEDKAAASKKAAEDALAAQAGAEDKAAVAEKAAEDALAAQKAAEHNMAAMKWAAEINKARQDDIIQLMQWYSCGQITNEQYMERYQSLPLEVSASNYIAPRVVDKDKDDQVLLGGVVSL